MARFGPAAGGGVDVLLDEAEIAALRGALALLDHVVGATPGSDDARDRLFPRPYLDPTEEEGVRDWERYVQPDLEQGTRAAMQAVVDSLASADDVGPGLRHVRLDAARADAWLVVLTDVRLVLGQRLGLTTDDDFDRLAAADPTGPAIVTYDWLTFLQDGLLRALTA